MRVKELGTVIAELEKKRSLVSPVSCTWYTVKYTLTCETDISYPDLQDTIFQMMDSTGYFISLSLYNIYCINVTQSEGSSMFHQILTTVYVLQFFLWFQKKVPSIFYWNDFIYLWLNVSLITSFTHHITFGHFHANVLPFLQPSFFQSHHW